MSRLKVWVVEAVNAHDEADSLIDSVWLTEAAAESRAQEIKRRGRDWSLPTRWQESRVSSHIAGGPLGYVDWYEGFDDGLVASL